MSSVVISGDTSGAITVAAPAVAGTNTATLPAATGTIVVGSSAVSAAGQIPFSTDGTSYTPTAKIVSGTVTATTSGTSIDFTSIPSWVKRITVMFQGVSTSGTNPYLIQLGTSGGIVSSGYVSRASNNTGAGTGTSATNGFVINATVTAAQLTNGNVIICLLDSSTNSWSSGGMLAKDDATNPSAGAVTLSAALTQLRLTTTTGTDTFDAGKVNILYE